MVQNLILWTFAWFTSSTFIGQNVLLIIGRTVICPEHLPSFSVRQRRPARMVEAIHVFEVILAVLSWISEIFLSSSVITFYIIEWKKKQQFSVCDKIFIYMAFTKLFLQCSSAINNLIYIFWFSQVMTKQGALLMFVFNFFLIHDNIWHSAWLSVHYYLKLVSPSHSVFIQMNKRLSTSIIPMLIVTSVGVFLINLPFMWTISFEFLPNKTDIGSSNNFILYDEPTVIICNIIIGCCLPFLVSLICIGLSVSSLVRHIWRVKSNVSQFSSSPQLQGHVRAARTMILQLLLNLLLYLSVIGLSTTSSFNPGMFWEVILFSGVMFSPSAQSLILILGNPKLKKKLLGFAALT